MEIEEGDELWIVIDVDKWGENKLDELCKQCEREGFHIAASNPCFELWLVLHQPNPRVPPSAQECTIELTRMLGRKYDKADYKVSVLIAHVNTAVQHARRLDNDSGDPWPHQPGTHVYKLVEKLIK